MCYKTFLYNIFLEPENAITEIKEEFNFTYIIITMFLVFSGWFINNLYLEGYSTVNSAVFITSINFINIIFRYLILAFIIHSFLSLLNYNGNIRLLFASLLLCQAPFILFNYFGLLSFVLSENYMSIIKIGLNTWSLFLIFISIKVNYSISTVKSGLLYFAGISFIFFIVFFYFILSIVVLIMNIF